MLSLKLFVEINFKYLDQIYEPTKKEIQDNLEEVFNEATKFIGLTTIIC